MYALVSLLAIYRGLVYTRPLSIANSAFWLAIQPLSIRDGERSCVRIKLNELDYFENYGVIAVYRLFSRN